MPIFELTWQAFGTLKIEADTVDEAKRSAAAELTTDPGPTDVRDYQVDGVDVELA
ncbi:hypothetical protein [Mycolicibacterium wolinskyi]|uniref:hypothetical protein n=1 Tax=Mycolicibacterium wolinskyi TaxID=59750 RepID=UPI00391797E4